MLLIISKSNPFVEPTCNIQTLIFPFHQLCIYPIALEEETPYQVTWILYLPKRRAHPHCIHEFMCCNRVTSRTNHYDPTLSAETVQNKKPSNVPPFPGVVFFFSSKKNIPISIPVSFPFTSIFFKAWYRPTS